MLEPLHLPVQRTSELNKTLQLRGGSPDRVEGEVPLVECYRAPLLLALQLESGAKPAMDIADFNLHLDRLLEQSEAFGERAGYRREVIRDSSYALVALFDDLIPELGEPWTRAWHSSSIELRRFGGNLAGDRFFELLERARRSHNEELLLVFLFCLRAGFKGRLVNNAHGRAALVRTLEDELSDTHAQPRWHAEKDGALEGAGQVPTRLPRPWVPPLIAAFFMFCVFLVFDTFIVERQAERSAAALDALIEPTPQPEAP